MFQNFARKENGAHAPDCICHTCDREIHHLGIMSHRAMHRRRKEDCRITFSTGVTYDYAFAEQGNRGREQMMRWLATVYYRTDNGTVDVTHDLDELSDIDQAVEAGPHWDTIEKVVITRGEVMIEGLTVEAAEQL